MKAGVALSTRAACGVLLAIPKPNLPARVNPLFSGTVARLIRGHVPILAQHPEKIATQRRKGVFRRYRPRRALFARDGRTWRRSGPFSATRSITTVSNRTTTSRSSRPVTAFTQIAAVRILPRPRRLPPLWSVVSALTEQGPKPPPDRGRRGSPQVPAGLQDWQ